MTRRQSAIRLHWPAIACIALIIGLFIAAWTVPESTKVGVALSVLATIVPTMIAIAQYLYARVDHWRLGISRAAMWFGNRETSWAIRCEYNVDNSGAALEAAERVIKQLPSAGARLLAGDARTRAYVWRGVTLRLLATMVPDPVEDSWNDVLVVEVPSFRRAFRSLDDAIRNEVSPLLDAFERAVQASSQKYSVAIDFTDGNPYFGLFVNNVSRAGVTRFDIEMVELEPVTGQHEVVHVRHDQIQLVAASAQSVGRLSSRYLALEQLKEVS